MQSTLWGKVLSRVREAREHGRGVSIFPAGKPVVCTTTGCDGGPVSIYHRLRSVRTRPAGPSTDAYSRTAYGDTTRPTLGDTRPWEMPPRLWGSR
eukprot:8795079-Pyramimonas_sp.AAC.1